MNPEDDWEVFCATGRVDVKDLALMAGIRVRDVGCEILRLRDGHEQQECECGFHGLPFWKDCLFSDTVRIPHQNQLLPSRFL